MARRSMSESAGPQLRAADGGGPWRPPVETAPGMTRVRLLGQTRLAVRDSYDVSLDGLIAEAGCDSGSGPSTMKVQSRHLLVADFGVWTGFLGLIAIVAVDETFPKILGAVGLICGLAIAIVGLDKVVRDRPPSRPPAGLYVDDNREGRISSASRHRPGSVDHHPTGKPRAPGSAPFGVGDDDWPHVDGG